MWVEPVIAFDCTGRYTRHSLSKGIALSALATHKDNAQKSLPPI